jgi:dienelactone hydrolase
VVNGLGHLVRLGDGWIRQLYRTSDSTRFSVGPGFQVSIPETGHVTFRMDGERAGSLAIDVPGANTTAVRQRFQETDVEITAPDGVTLAATITEPMGPGPHPAIVVVQGGEAGTRVLYGVWANFYAGLGFTVLTYDKRGNGKSGGQYPGDNSERRSLDIFAADASACAKFVAAWPGVDPHRVGFHGGSQGGWTVPLAIQQFREAAFAVLLSGPAVSVGAQTVWSLASGDASVVPTQPMAEIEAAMRGAANTGYQPRPVLASLTQPVLWLNGANDRRVPTQATFEVLGNLHKPNFELHVLPGVGHGLLENPNGLDQNDAKARYLSPELFPIMAAWLARRAGTSPTS